MGTPTIDLDKFKAAKPWRDFTFWVALLTSLAMLLPVLDEAWRSRAFPTGGQLAAATSPLSAWLLGNGMLRYGSVRAAGATAAAVAPEIARGELYANAAAGRVTPADELEPTEDDIAEAQAFHAHLAADPVHNGHIMVPRGADPA
jgi:hypothetical protein